MRELLRDFWQFTLAVVSHWQAYVMGGLFAFAVGVFEKLTGKGLSRNIFLSALITFLFVAFFMAWRDQYKDRRRLEDEVRGAKEHTLPRLTGTIEQVVTGDSPDLGGAQLFLLMSIRNSAAPSIVEGWGISIVSPKMQFKERPTFIQDGLKLFDPSGEIIAQFQRKDAIYEKTVSPIDNGGLVRGWLRYVLKGFRAELLHERGTKLIVSIKDVAGKEYEIVHEMSGGSSGEPLYFPGAEQPFARMVLPPQVD